MLFGTLVALLVAVPAVIAQNFMINTPNGVTECQPSRITWTGGSPPYILTLTEGVTTGGATLKEFDGLTGTGFTWLVDLQANTNFILNLKDMTGTIAQSASVTIAAGGSTSCLNTSVEESASGVTTESGSAGAPAPAPTTPGNTTPAPTSGSSTPAASSPTAPAASSASTPAASSGTSGGSAAAPSPSKGAASHLSVSGVCITGLMGLLGAILY